MRCSCFPMLSDTYSAALIGSRGSEPESRREDAPPASGPWTDSENLFDAIENEEEGKEDDVETARTRPLRLDSLHL